MTRHSAQPCGCDAGANWICERHREEALGLPTWYPCASCGAEHDVPYCPFPEVPELPQSVAAVGISMNNTLTVDARLKKELSELAEGITATGTRALSLAQVAERLQQLAEQVGLLTGAMAAQDERERHAGEKCGVPYDLHACDWPDWVAEEVLGLRQQLAEVTTKERREFAWAEECMAKSRTLELKLDAAEQQIATLQKERDEWQAEALRIVEHDWALLRQQIAALTLERDRETELRRRADAHNAMLRELLDAKPYSDEFDAITGQLEEARAQIATLTRERDELLLDRHQPGRLSDCGHYRVFAMPVVHEDGSESPYCMQCHSEDVQQQIATLTAALQEIRGLASGYQTAICREIAYFAETALAAVQVKDSR